MRTSYQYCERCDNPESGVERVSNYDNLRSSRIRLRKEKPSTKMSDSDLVAIIAHGGPAQTQGDLTTLNLVMPKDKICFACHQDFHNSPKAHSGCELFLPGVPRCAQQSRPMLLLKTASAHGSR